jgi:adenylate kinase family enzyme
MKRVVIVGTSGSGKSTLARQMNEILGIPAVHIDTLRFIEGKPWEEIPKDEFYQKVDAAVAADEWIFEGCSASTLPQRLERCDTVIFLDFNRFFCLYHAIKRRIQIKKRPRLELPKSCIDKIDKTFLRWILFDYYNGSRPRIVKMINASGKTIYHIKSRKHVMQLIEDIRI